MKKSFFAVLLILSLKIFAQTDFYENSVNYKTLQNPDTVKNDSLSKFYISPNFSLWFGNQTFIALNPQILYKTTDFASLGFGSDFEFLSNTQTYDKTTYYGIRFFYELYFLKFLVQRTDLHFLNRKVFQNPLYRRQWKAYYYIGGGLKLDYSQKVFTELLVFWNPGIDLYSLHGNPFFAIKLFINI